MMATWRIQVIGKVQGVYFRASTQEQAARLGLRGWVRNEPDGSVRIAVVGDRTDFEQFLQWLHQGSPLAEVRKVIVSEASEPVEYKDFRIQR